MRLTSSGGRFRCFRAWSTTAAVNKLRRIELAHGKSVEPSLLPARQTLQLSPSNVPQLDVDALRPTLAEQKHRHRGSVAAGEKEKQNHSVHRLPDAFPRQLAASSADRFWRLVAFIGENSRSNAPAMHRALATDSAAATQFLQTAFSPDDWVALFLKSHANGQVAQRVGSVQWAASPSTQTWLHQMNSRGFDVYVSVNAIAAGRRSRARDAIASVRHVFLEVDRDGDATLASVEGRSDLPSPSYVLHSSPGRLHLFWRATGFEKAYVERLQKQLALELSTDTAATPATQTTRLPGFFNRKRAELHLVTIDYRDG